MIQLYQVGLDLACVFAFFFSYGMVENIIRQWIRARQIGEPFSEVRQRGTA